MTTNRTGNRTSNRDRLLQARDEVLLTDGGLETTLIFDMGFDLPEFAAFALLTTAEGRRGLREYYRRHAHVARRQGVDVVLDTPTWRASADWGTALGFDADALAAVNVAAVDLLREVRDEFAPLGTDVVISGNVGPRSDGYQVSSQMTADAAAAFHRAQIATLAAAGVDLVTVLTMTHVGEAVGVARAAAAVDVPVVVSFTVETDGRLPSGQPLGDAIEAVDHATGAFPVAYGINCAHPDHFLPAITAGGDWVDRIGLVRANASRLSHAELDQAEELDAGDPIELAGLYRELQRALPNLRVMGGCCGTDHRHIDRIGDACLPAAAR